VHDSRIYRTICHINQYWILIVHLYNCYKIASQPWWWWYGKGVESSWMLYWCHCSTVRVLYYIRSFVSSCIWSLCWKMRDSSSIIKCHKTRPAYSGWKEVVDTVMVIPWPPYSVLRTWSNLPTSILPRYHIRNMRFFIDVLERQDTRFHSMKTTLFFRTLHIPTSCCSIMDGGFDGDVLRWLLLLLLLLLIVELRRERPPIHESTDISSLSNRLLFPHTGLSMMLLIGTHSMKDSISATCRGGSSINSSSSSSSSSSDCGWKRWMWMWMWTLMLLWMLF